MVHSPVELDQALREGLEALGGGVGHIVSPNYEHLKYAAQWAEAFPKAAIHACPGLPERMPEVPWTSELFAEAFKGRQQQPAPEAWEGSIEAVHFDCERNPFNGKPFFNEVVLFHTRSKTFFCADTFWNYPSGSRPNFELDKGAEGTGRVHDCPKVPIGAEMVPSVNVPRGTAAWKFGMDKVYLPFYRQFMVGGGRREAYKAAVGRVLAWAPETIVPCHGDTLRGREACRMALTKHFFGPGESW